MIGGRLSQADGVRGRERAVEARRANARAAYADLAPMVNGTGPDGKSGMNL